jgi:glycine cleavage system regulatory protein
VREVTAALAPLEVNIEDLVTSTENSAWSGERLFRATARLSLPAQVSLDQVQDALEAISAEIIVDLTFNASVR